MPHLASISFPLFIFKNNNLFCFSLINDMAVDRNVVQNRLADTHVLTIRKHEHLVKRNRTADIPGKLLNSSDIALTDFILFSARIYNSVHLFNPLSRYIFHYFF